ncbi:MAG: response regulator [Candidatus Omnitrophica bacterium]|nr:response regulator [Candidatus Omnitrophota bacterium]
MAKKQIYIVDDDESVRRSLGLLLSTFGFQTQTFSSAEEFFSMVSVNDSGLLILDIHMPGLSGWTALQRIYAGIKRKVIVITADKNGGLMERALKTGAMGFLQKPFEDNDLVNLINKVY